MDRAGGRNPGPAVSLQNDAPPATSRPGDPPVHPCTPTPPAAAWTLHVQRGVSGVCPAASPLATRLPELRLGLTSSGA